MTDRELFEKALEAMEHLNLTGDTQVFYLCYAPELIPALKERLAQPEQEPVAWLHRDSWGTLKLSQIMPPPVGAFPVYTAPQPEPVIDKAAARRIATALGWVPPGDTSQDRVDQAENQRQEQEPVCAHDIPKIKCSFCHVEYKQPEQEPVAWRNKETGEFCTGGFLRKDWARWTPLYTTPPRREWVGLTEEQIDALVIDKDGLPNSHLEFARAIETKLREKNT